MKELHVLTGNESHEFIKRNYVNYYTEQRKTKE